MSTIKKNFLYNSLYQLLLLIIPLMTTPYISRVLGAEQIGVYSYNYSIANYFVIFIMLGLNNYGNRAIAKIRDDRKLLSSTFCSIYVMQLILGIVLNSLYFIYVFFISRNLDVSLCLSLYVISACFDINWLFFGLEKFKFITIRNTIIKTISTVLIFVFVKKQSDVISYCLILSISTLISQVCLWPYVKKHIRFCIPSLSNIRKHIKPNLFLFLTVIAVSVYKIMDKIMLGSMTNVIQVGFYESSEKIILIPTALITSLGTVMLPRMSNLTAKNINDEKSNTMIYKSLLLSIFLSSSLCFGIMAVSREFVPMFYGHGYELCIKLYLILLPSCLFLSFANVIRTQYLLPHQMDRDYVISAFLGAGINFFINSILIPRYGAVGAATGTLLAEIFVCFYQCYQVNKHIPVKKYFIRCLPFVGAGVIMFLVVFNISFNYFPFLNFVIKILIGILTYFTVLVLLKKAGIIILDDTDI